MTEGFILVSWFKLSRELLEGGKSWAWIREEGLTHRLGPWCFGKVKLVESLILTHPERL